MLLSKKVGFVGFSGLSELYTRTFLQPCASNRFLWQSILRWWVKACLHATIFRPNMFELRHIRAWSVRLFTACVFCTSGRPDFSVNFSPTAWIVRSCVLTPDSRIFSDVGGLVKNVGPTCQKSVALQQTAESARFLFSQIGCESFVKIHVRFLLRYCRADWNMVDKS